MTTVMSDNPLLSVQMMPDEIEYIENIIATLPDDGLMVEWGSGGSTLHWLSKLKPTQNLVSIEHSEGWYNQVAIAAAQYNNFVYFGQAVSSEYYDHVYGQPSEENPFNTKNYVCPDKLIYNADIYFIDGIVRGACLAALLLNRKKKNSRILFHDYEPRYSAYDWITQFCKVEIVGSTMASITFE